MDKSRRITYFLGVKRTALPGLVKPNQTFFLLGRFVGYFRPKTDL